MNTLICIYCQLPFASAEACPYCGGVVDKARKGALPRAANEDQPLKEEDLAEEFEIIPLGETVRFGRFPGDGKDPKASPGGANDLLTGA